jgi:hypothetical protein
MLEVFKELISVVGGGAGLVSFVVVVLTKLGEHKIRKREETHKTTLTKEVEKLKAELGKEVGAQMERVKLDLAKEGKEHEIRFRKLHERFADVIDNVFKEFMILQSNYRNLIEKNSREDDNMTKEKFRKLVESYTKFAALLTESNLYIPDEVYFKIQAASVWIETKTGEFLQTWNLAVQDRRKLSLAEYQIFLRSREELNDMILEIRDKLQVMLGFK